jgi:hypothetical protein
MVAAILAYLLTPMGRVVAFSVAIAAVVGVGWVVYGQIEQSGYDRAVREIAAENQEAIDRVHVAKNKLASCIDRGKSWDQSRGVCVE